VLEFLNNVWGLGTDRVIVKARQATLPGGDDSLESIPGRLKRVQIRALAGRYDNLFILASQPP
jgi:hypothetical protein